MSRSVAIIGYAAAPVGKWQTPPDADEHVLEHEVLGRLAIEAAHDAGIDRSDIGALAMSLPRPYTQQKYFATFLANYLGLPLTAGIAEVLGNGMTGALAFESAANEILLGRAKVALAMGINVETAISARDHMMSSMRAVGDVDFQAPFGITPIAWYAMDANRYIHEHGSSREQIATVAVKNRLHASMNALAHFRSPITLEEVLAQRPIVEPLGLYEVPPRSDGAAVLVLADEDVARALGRPYVRVRGRGFFHEGAHQISAIPNDMIRLEAAERAGAEACAQAGIRSVDVDFAELYAPCTIVEILVAEALGLTPRGHGAAWAAEGRTTLGGDMPLCTSGGLTSRGHPAYMTPLYSFVEAVEQLRGTAGGRQVAGARLGLVSAELGNYNAALVHVLEAVA
ncbi:thiolase family protein [Microbacterium sp. SLBN-111]|uniref:thiolase family protein n=1 Tax=Microbacterium sp. SLBN-111 TaxID=3377733 RepID=UPI003C74D8F1